MSDKVSHHQKDEEKQQEQDPHEQDGGGAVDGGRGQEDEKVKRVKEEEKWGQQNPTSKTTSPPPQFELQSALLMPLGVFQTPRKLYSEVVGDLEFDACRITKRVPRLLARVLSGQGCFPPRRVL
ncbi:hypothetical protein E2C01_039219 [Portunus trituberculatus]|uniref:Uncharacterized protein n=1 Tax=Portunus trituberculatus TaxID=210409 RepID=A0A5B7FK65_PORTR|nr:hypothetical protein [Portunus trituberculatus]